MEQGPTSGTSKVPGGLGSDALLEEYLESIETLPNELRRGLLLMRELDEKIDLSQLKSAQLEKKLLEKAQGLIQQRGVIDASSGGFGGSARSNGKNNGNSNQVTDYESILNSISQLEDGTDVDLREIMELFDRSIYAADEKIQVSYQLSDHVRQCINNLDISIGKVNNAKDASKMSRFAIGSMVAIQVFDDDSAEPSYILGKVVRLVENTDQWVIADAEEETKHHTVTQDQITELVDLPFNELPKYKKGDKVMALYPNTTTFYPAEVQVPARKAVGSNPPYLVVTFDGDFDVDGNVPKLVVACNFVFRSLNQRLE
jgi:hypothetical protein